MRKKDKNKLCFAVCIDNKDYEASLELGKLYRVITDDEASSHGYIRIIDESGDDYGYSAKRFFPMKIPQEVEKALVSLSQMHETLVREL